MNYQHQYPYEPKTNWFGIVLVGLVALFMIIGLATSKRWKTALPVPTVTAQGNISFALITVPVPIQDDLEGNDIIYRVSCHLEDGILSCSEANKEN